MGIRKFHAFLHVVVLMVNVGALRLLAMWRMLVIILLELRQLFVHFMVVGVLKLPAVLKNFLLMGCLRMHRK